MGSQDTVYILSVNELIFLAVVSVERAANITTTPLSHIRSLSSTLLLLSVLLPVDLTARQCPTIN